MIRLRKCVQNITLRCSRDWLNISIYSDYLKIGTQQCSASSCCSFTELIFFSGWTFQWTKYFEHSQKLICFFRYKYLKLLWMAFSRRFIVQRDLARIECLRVEQTSKIVDFVKTPENRQFSNINILNVIEFS